MSDDTSEQSDQITNCEVLETDEVPILLENGKSERDISHYLVKIEGGSSDEENMSGSESEEDVGIEACYDALEEEDDYGEFVSGTHVDNSCQVELLATTNLFDDDEHEDRHADNDDIDINISSIPSVDPATRIAPLTEGFLSFTYIRLCNDYRFL